MKKLEELLAERTAMDEAIKRAKREAEGNALRQVHDLIAEFGFTAQQVFPWKPSVKARVEAKYQNPETGEVWTGRGKAPRWIADKERASFLIEKPEPRQAGPYLAEMAAQAADRRR